MKNVAIACNNASHCKGVPKIKHVFEIRKIVIASLGSQSLPLELDIPSSNGYRITRGDSYEFSKTQLVKMLLLLNYISILYDQRIFNGDVTAVMTE